MQYIKETKTYVFDFGTNCLGTPWYIESISDDKPKWYPTEIGNYFYGIMVDARKDSVMFAYAMPYDYDIRHVIIPIEDVITQKVRLHRAYVITQTESSKPAGILGGHRMTDEESREFNNPMCVMLRPDLTYDEMKLALDNLKSFYPDTPIITAVQSNTIEGQAKPTGSEVI